VVDVVEVDVLVVVGAAVVVEVLVDVEVLVEVLVVVVVEHATTTVPYVVVPKLSLTAIYQVPFAIPLQL
jgi:hypothetical protein